MNCEQFVEFLCDYLEGNLPAEQAEAFRAQLDDCPHCRAYLASYERTVKMSRKCIFCDSADDELPEDAPEDLVNAILSARKSPDS